MRNRYVFLVLILLLAAFLRFFNLAQNPPSLAWDEAAWGYNAYSLGIDGKDEFGRFLPLDYLESFGDFKPPMYAYLAVIPIKIFGLNEFATRFPSALLGVLTVLITYFLTKRIFYNSKLSENYALFASGFLAISPWHIMLSRAAFEANVASFFLICGVWLFLKAMQDKKWYLLLSIVSFTLSLYTFNTARIVAPLLVLLLIFGFRKQLLVIKRQVIFAAILGVTLILPTFKFFLTPQANLRFREVNIFSDSSVVTTANQEIANDGNKFWSKIIHNRRVIYGVEFIRHYFDNVSPSFLFIKGDGNPKFSTQTVGEMYLWDLPFFVAGILLLIRRKEGYWWIIPFWLVLGIIPAATARETPHALRIETTLPTFQILVAVGVVSFFSWVNNAKFSNILKKSIKTFLLLLLIFNFIYFYHDYLAHYARQFSGEWQYGYKQSISYVQSVQGNYDKVYITNDLGRPYIYYLFYTQENPKNFRQEAIIKRDAFGFVEVTGFGQYRFMKNLPYEKSAKKNLYINTPQNVPTKASVLKTFNLLNGVVVLIAYE